MPGALRTFTSSRFVPIASSPGPLLLTLTLVLVLLLLQNDSGKIEIGECFFLNLVYTIFKVSKGINVGRWQTGS